MHPDPLIFHIARTQQLEDRERARVHRVAKAARAARRAAGQATARRSRWRWHRVPRSAEVGGAA